MSIGGISLGVNVELTSLLLLMLIVTRGWELNSRYLLGLNGRHFYSLSITHSANVRTALQEPEDNEFDF